MKYLTRWVTGLVAAPFLVFFIWKGGTVFSVFIGVVCLIALHEYFRMVFHFQNPTPWVVIFLIISILSGAAILWAAHRDEKSLILGSISLNLMICSLCSMPLFKLDSAVLEQVAKQIQGVIYIPVLLSCLILIRNGVDGMKWIFFLLSIIFAGDIGALYAGTYLGKHKLCPSISPGKTIEGSMGGILSNLLIGSLFKAIFFPKADWGISLLFFVCAGAAGQIGDLFESELKRAANMKDSGSILPGHGGMLDRIDALLFAAPVALIFKKYLM